MSLSHTCLSSLLYFPSLSRTHSFSTPLSTCPSHLPRPELLSARSTARATGLAVRCRDGAACAPQNTEYAPIIYTTSTKLPAGQDLMW
ncbi:unnamed protein product, partial [Closterium sp. Naga37s-1]